jgi:hypothetical protein
MAELKTKRTEERVDAFLDAIDDETRRKDCRAVLKIMKKATKAKPKMWGPSIVGFGDYHYQYESGREGDWFLAGGRPLPVILRASRQSSDRGRATMDTRGTRHRPGNPRPLRVDSR